MNIRTSISSGRARNEPRQRPLRSILRSSRIAPTRIVLIVLILTLSFMAGCAAQSEMHGNDDLYGIGEGDQAGDHGSLSGGQGEDAYGIAGRGRAAADSATAGSSRPRGSGGDVYGSSGRRSASAASGTGAGASRRADLYPRRRQASPSAERKRSGNLRSEDAFGAAETDGQKASGSAETGIAKAQDAYGADKLGYGAAQDSESPARSRQEGDSDAYDISRAGERKGSRGEAFAGTAPAVKTVGPAESVPAQPSQPVVAGPRQPEPAPARSPAGEGSVPARGTSAAAQKPVVAATAEPALGRGTEQPAAPPEPKAAKAPAALPEAPKEVPSPPKPAAAPAPEPAPAAAAEKTPAVTPPPPPQSAKEPAAVAALLPAEETAELKAADRPAEKADGMTVSAEGSGKTPDQRGGGARPDAGSGPPEAGAVVGLNGTAALGQAGKAERGITVSQYPGIERDRSRESGSKKGPWREQDVTEIDEDLYRGKPRAAGPARSSSGERERGLEADLYDRKQASSKRLGLNGVAAAGERAGDDYDVSARRGRAGENVVVINRPPNISGMTGLLITNSAYTLEQGKRSAGISIMVEDSSSPDFRVMQMPVTLTFGIADDKELGVKAKIVDIYNETPPQNERGFGDAEVSFKWHFVKEGLILPDLAIGVAGILPMASEQRGLNEVMDWGLKVMAMASQEKRITENQIMGAYVEAQAVFIDELIQGGSTPGAERYGIINIGVLFPVTRNNRFQLIAEHNQVLYKSSYQPTLLEGNQGATTAAVRYVTEQINLTAGVQYIDKEKNSSDNTFRVIGTASYTF